MRVLASRRHLCLHPVRGLRVRGANDISVDRIRVSSRLSGRFGPKFCLRTGSFVRNGVRHLYSVRRRVVRVSGVCSGVLSGWLRVLLVTFLVVGVVFINSSVKLPQRNYRCRSACFCGFRGRCGRVSYVSFFGETVADSNLCRLCRDCVHRCGPSVIVSRDKLASYTPELVGSEGCF